MTSLNSLNGALLATYHSLRRQPPQAELTWAEVLKLLRHVTHVTEAINGNLHLERGGETLILPTPSTSALVEAGLLGDIAAFLHRTEANAPAAAPCIVRSLMVINHREVRLFHPEFEHDVPQRLLPHEPSDFFRHAPNSLDFARGKERPNPDDFFNPVARALRTSDEILVFGAGKGTSSEMEQFMKWCRETHPDVARRVIGTLVVNETHLTKGQLLASARDFYRDKPHPHSWEPVS